MDRTDDTTFEAGGHGPVAFRTAGSRGAFATLVFAHGAGAGIDHPFMTALPEALAHHGVATMTYHFPYMEAGRRRPDRRAVLVETVRAAVERARALDPDRPLFAGGKSMGGRMTSHAQALEPLPGVEGIVFVGFPLHPAGKPGTDRADHLDDVGLPMLFLQGTRDRLAGLDLLTPVVDRLGDRAVLHVVEGADHGFHVLKRSGRGEDEVLEELARATASWCSGTIGSRRRGA